LTLLLLPCCCLCCAAGKHQGRHACLYGEAAGEPLLLLLLLNLQPLLLLGLKPSDVSM
jgi:hypothetical protein